MKYKVVISGQEFVLSDTDRNQQAVDKIQKGIHPGLVTLDIAKGEVSANLSEPVPYVLICTVGAEKPRRKVVVA